MHKQENPRFSPAIGVDLMGSECDPSAIFASILSLLEKNADPFFIHFFGSSSVEKTYQSNPIYQTFDQKKGVCTFHVCKETIHMEDDPLSAALDKTASSLIQGIEALKVGTLSGFISCGNTGALLSAAKLRLPLMRSIERPALCVLLPTKKAPVALLDVGANATAKEKHLVQFAKMGVAYQQALGVAFPKVALLNIGKEPLKGGIFRKRCYDALSENTSFSFVGNVEPKTVLEGEAVDVVVTEGFIGNIFLKTAEASFSFCTHLLQKKAIDQHAFFPGALLLGTKGLLIKCHGDTNPDSIALSIENMLQIFDKKLVEKIDCSLQENGRR